MSRSQEGAVVDTSSAQNAQDNTNAQTSYKDAQTDVGNYESALGKFAAANPYGEGGQFQKLENQQLANTADAGAQAAGNALQSAAVRTGQNAGGAIAATEAMQQANTRQLSAEESQANAGRIGAGSAYNAQVVSDTAVPEQMEAGLAGQQATAGNQALGIDQSASQTPSFMDELGQGLISAGGQVGAAFAGKCWIARELYGSWTDSRVILLRIWLHEAFRKRWYGPVVLWAYARWGERVAESLKTRPMRRAFFERLFDAGVEQAEAWHDARMAAAINLTPYAQPVSGEVARGR